MSKYVREAPGRAGWYCMYRRLGTQHDFLFLPGQPCQFILRRRARAHMCVRVCVCVCLCLRCLFLGIVPFQSIGHKSERSRVSVGGRVLLVSAGLFLVAKRLQLYTAPPNPSHPPATGKIQSFSQDKARSLLFTWGVSRRQFINTAGSQ